MCDCEKKIGDYFRTILGDELRFVESTNLDALILSHKNQRNILRGGSEQAQRAAERMRWFPNWLRKWLRGE